MLTIEYNPKPKISFDVLNPFTRRMHEKKKILPPDLGRISGCILRSGKLGEQMLRLRVSVGSGKVRLRRQSCRVLVYLSVPTSGRRGHSQRF